MGRVRKESLVGFLHELAVRKSLAQEKVENTGRSLLKPTTGNRVLGRKDRRHASSSAPKVKEQSDVQCSCSRGASPDRRTRISCAWKSVCLLSNRELQCTCWTKVVWAQMKWILCGDPEPLRRWWPQMEKHKKMFTISIYSWQCKYSTIRQQFYRLESFAKNTDIHISGLPVDSHNGPKVGITCLARRTVTYLMLYQDCQHFPAAARPTSTSKPQEQLTHSEESGSASSDPVTYRRDKPAARKPLLTDPQKPAARNRLPQTQNRMEADDPTQGILDWWISGSWRNMCPLKFLKEQTQIRKVL